MTIRIGLCAYDVRALDFCALAAAADEVEFDSLWLGEHVVLPLGYGSDHPTSSGETTQHHTGPIIDPSTTLIDPLVTFGAAAITTTRITLASGVFLVALRHPIVVARMTATLQSLAGGRFMLGIGAGWLREEFEALGVPFERRGARLDESIDVLRALWSGETVRHDGTFFSFGPVRLGPAPVDVPLILGGNTERALLRAAARADGWFSSGTPSFDEARELRDRIDAVCTHVGRSRPLPLWFRVPSAEPHVLARYEDEGFERIVVWADQLWPGGDDSPMEKRAAFTTAVELLELPRRPAVPSSEEVTS